MTSGVETAFEQPIAQNLEAAVDNTISTEPIGDGQSRSAATGVVPLRATSPSMLNLTPRRVRLHDDPNEAAGHVNTRDMAKHAAREHTPFVPVPVKAENALCNNLFSTIETIGKATLLSSEVGTQESPQPWIVIVL